MPPKPPIRIPNKPAPNTRKQPQPAASTKPPSQPSSKPRTPPPHNPTSWYRAPNLGSTARWTARWGSTYVVLLCGVLFVRDTYISYDKVTGASMAPTMNPHTHETGQRDWIFVRPFVWRMAKAGYGVQRGDVVTFWKPQKPEEMGIKRVIAVEGDEVWPRSGYVVEAEEKGKYLGGMPDGLADEDEDSIACGRREKGVVVVPYGHVWVEGDNWRDSWDSRHYGPISKGLLLGKAVGIWRGWGEFMGVRDMREKKEKKMASRVVEGKMEAPQVFLE